MAKKKAKRSKVKPKVNKAVAGFTFNDLEELVQQGFIKFELNEDGDDAVCVVVPDELHVPEIVDQETQSAEDRLLIEEHTLPARLRSLLRVEALAAWTSFARFKLLPMLESVTGKTPQQLTKILREHGIESMALPFLEQVTFRGFDFALTRYAEQIKHVPELAAWHKKRANGGDTGRAESSRRADDLAHRIRAKWAEIEAAGEKATNDTVAAAMRQDGHKCSRSTVIRAFKRQPVKPSKR